MLDPRSFIRTIYLGDRAIKGFEVDSWGAVVRIRVDLISRVRSDDGVWDFYDKEDIEDGYISFGDVEKFEISPAGAMPNDYISSFTIEPLLTDGYRFVLESSSTIGAYAGQCVKICIEAKTIGLIDPQRPDFLIQD